MKNKIRYTNLEFAKDLWHFFRIHKGEFIFYTSLLIISLLLGLIPPIILARVIDLFISNSMTINIFYAYLTAFGGVLIMDTILRHIGKYYFSLFANKVQKHAKVESFEKVMQGDLVWHDKDNTGNKIQKITEGEGSLGKFMDFYINRGLNIVVNILGVIIIFAFFSLKYSALAVLFIVSYLFFEYRLNRRIAEKTLDINLAKEKSMGKVVEFSSNITTIKSLGIESSSHKQIKMQEEKLFEAKNKRKKASSQKWATVQIISSLFSVIFIFFVGSDILKGILSIGVIVIYMNYLSKLQNSLNIISSDATHFIDMKYGIFRMMEIYRSIPENDTGKEKLKNWNRIIIKDLSFKYKNEKVLENLNLEINRGEKIGIVGGSGSGKSTLFKLLLKLYSPQNGDIMFDNRSIKNIEKESLIKKISVVPQETELFNLTLKENITISSLKKMNHNQYKKALYISKLNKVVDKLKNKDMSMIGEKGIRLSGGEKQRLGIARALYKGSEIIILDESTSNLDYETERKILESFNKNLRDKTIIFSAHRLTTLKNMDKIFYIHKGRIIEQGSYCELIAKKGKFYNLLKNKTKSRTKVVK
jgi:ABC-type multidrug transport system fused ATPase/permease subunit